MCTTHASEHRQIVDHVRSSWSIRLSCCTCCCCADLLVTADSCVGMWDATTAQPWCASLSQFAARIKGRLTQQGGWAAADGQRVPFRSIIETHALDSHLPSLINVLHAVRPAAVPSGCGILLMTIWRHPTQQYLSLYKYNVFYKRETRRFREFVSARPHEQATDLLRGVERLGFSPLRHRKNASTHQVYVEAVRMLADFDVVAPLEDFGILLGLLCRVMSLPRCPCYVVANEAGGRDEAVKKRLLQRANESGDGGLIWERQQQLWDDKHALHELIHNAAWVDFRIHEWSFINFAQRVQAVRAVETVSMCQKGE